ncbi:MAG: hypothetical protein ACYDCO_17710 [Armatimonadota bacterium]
MAEAILTYDAGTLLLEGEVPGRLPPQFLWDPRVEKFRAPAVARRGILRFCEGQGITVRDCISRARKLALELRTTFAPRAYQQEAYQAWEAAGGCGTVVLPTGAWNNRRVGL